MAPWASTAKDSHRHNVFPEQRGQRVAARWGTSKPRVCSRFSVQSTAQSNNQSPDGVPVFTPRCKEIIKLLLPSGKQQHGDRQLQHSLVHIVLSVVSDTVYFNHALLLGSGLMTLLIGSYRQIENDPVSNRF